MPYSLLQGYFPFIYITPDSFDKVLIDSGMKASCDVMVFPLLADYGAAKMDRQENQVEEKVKVKKDGKTVLSVEF
ncbi:MAG: hypothetical protein PHP64_08885 [Actinomycetota bacterium]|nr:hypothetical protein [Actinomycetota bacterium]